MEAWRGPQGGAADDAVANAQTQGAMSFQHLQLVEAVCAGVGQKVQEALAEYCAGAAQEQIRALEAQLGLERQAHAESRAAVESLRTQVSNLQAELFSASQARTRAEGCEAAYKEVVESCMAKLDDERFGRKELQAKLDAAGEELLTVQRELHLMSVRLEKETKGRKKDNPKDGRAPLQDLLNRLELSAHLMTRAEQKPLRHLNAAEAARLEGDLVHFATAGMLLPAVEVLKSGLPGAQQPAAEAIVAHFRWAGGAGSPGSTSYALEAGAFPFLVRMLQEKGTLAKPALMAMAALVAAGGRNRAAVCEAIASEGAVAPLVELVGGMDRGTQEAGLDLMLELCRTATKHCAAVALAEGFAALMPLIAMPGAAERPDMCAKACYVLSEIVASISSSRVALKDIGGIGPLMELLSCGHQELRSPAAKVLATLADTAEVRGQLLLSGAVQPVVQLLREAPAGGPSSRIAALALCNLSAGLDENLPGSESMLDAPVLSALVDVLAGCPDPETLMWCCKAASRMARASENARRCLCKSGCVEALLRLLMLLGSWAAREQVKHSNRGEGPCEALVTVSAMAAALGELAEADVENCANTLEISRVTSLLARLLSQHPGLPTSEEVACSLGRIAAARPHLIKDCDLVPAMVILLKGGTVPGQKAAADALGQFQKSTNDMPANRGDPAVAAEPECLGLVDGVLSSLVDLVSITSKGHGQGGTSSCLAVLSTIRLLVWNTAASKALVDAFGLPAMTAIMAGNFPAELRLLSAKVVWRVVSLMPDGAAALPVVEDIANTMADGSLGATQVVAIRILQSLARFDECSLAITRAGAVDGLLGVLSSGGEPQCQAACYALGALAGAAEVGQAVLESGGLPVIVGLLDEGHLPETRAAAAEALGNLAYENYSESIVAAGALPPLIALLEEQGEVCSSAVHAVLNLTEETTRDKILEAGAVTRLVPLLSSPQIDLQLAAAMTLNNLASSLQSMQSIMQAGGAELLVALLEVQPEGGEASWNVVQHVAWVLTKLATDPSNKEAVKAAGGITRALQLVKEAAVFVKEEGGEFTLGSSIVPLPIREATWCAAIHMLQSVAHGWPEAQDMLLASGRMEQIVQLLQFGGGDLQEAAASLIHELIDSDAAAEPVEVERRKQTLLSLGVLEPLVQVLTRSPPGGDPGAEKEFAARALANLVDSQASRALVRDAGGVAALVAMLGDEQDEHRDAAVSALEALAKDEELMEVIMEAGAIPFLINMLPSQLLDECSAASSDAAATLMHLASNGACCVAIHSDGGVPRLLEALGTPCMLHAGITLQNLASHVVVGPLICTEELVQDLKKYIFHCSKSDIVQSVGAMIVLNFTENKDNHQALLDGGIVTALLGLLEDVDAIEEEAVESAAMAIFRLGASEEGCSAIIRGGGAERLCAVLEHSSTVVQRTAAQALCSLVQDVEALAHMVRQRTGRYFLRILAEMGDEDSRTLQNNRVMIRIGDAVVRLMDERTGSLHNEEVDVLVGLLRSKSEALQQVSCGCLCELPVHCMDVVSPKGMLPEMIHILTVAVAEQRKHAGQGSFAPAGHRQTWTIIGEKVAVSIRLATNVLCDLAMETEPQFLDASSTRESIYAMLEAICIPLQCNVTDGIDRNRVLSTLCCLAESPGARQVMIGMQAVQTLAGLIDQVLHALASDVCSLVPTEAERTLELIGHLLWQLSTDDPPAFVSDFAGYGGFVLLDRLLLADRSALTCLALKMLNLLVSTPHEANQDARLSVPRLVEIARAGTADLQEESINIIRKLAKDEESCSEIVASDAVPVLADILRSAQDVPILKACIKAIRTIGGWQGDSIVASQVIPLLVNTLNSSFSDLRTEGMLALLSLSNLDKARLAMHEAEAIPLLVLQLENDTIKCQECAAKVLHALAMHEESRGLMTAAGAVEAVVKMLEVKSSGGVSNSNEAAALAVQTLVYDSAEAGKQLLQTGAHHKLLELLGAAVQDNHVNAQAAAGAALVNLVQADEEIRAELTEAEGALEVIIDVLNSASLPTLADGAGMSRDDEGDMEAAQEAAASLIGMLAEEDDTCAEAVGQSNAISHFVDMLHSSNIGSRRASAFALRNLAVSDDNRLAMLEAGAIGPLVGLLQKVEEGDEQAEEAQTAAAGALQVLAMNDQCSIAIAAAGGIPSLVACLQNGSDFCKVVAAGALGTMAYNKENCARIVNEGGIPALVELLSLTGSGREEGQESAAVALYSLAVNEENRCKVVNNGAVQPLLEMLASDVPEAQEAAAQALGALAKSQVCRVSIGEVDGALPSLVKLLASEEQSVREEAARAIHNLALEPDSQAPALISAGAVEALLEMLKEKVMDGDYDTQRAACQALAVLSPHRGSPEALLRVEAGVSWLLQLLRPPTPAQVQALAAQTVAGFAADEQAAAEMQEGGAIATLLAMLSCPSPLWAARALVGLARRPDSSSNLLAIGAVPVVLQALEDPETRSDSLLEALLDLLGLLCQAGQAGQRSFIVGDEGIHDIAGVFAAGGEASCAAASKVLASLANDNAECIMAADILAALVGWIDVHGSGRFHSGGAEASLALCRVAALPQYGSLILEAGGAGALISILRQGNEDVEDTDMDDLQVEAAKALMTLAQIDGGVTAIVGCGGAEVLVSLLSLSDGMRRAARVAALSALETLAKGGEGACARVVVAGAMVPLRRLIVGSNEHEASLAASILDHLQGGGTASTGSTASSRARRMSSSSDVPDRQVVLKDSPGIVEEPCDGGEGSM